MNASAFDFQVILSQVIDLSAARGLKPIGAIAIFLVDRIVAGWAR